ncbi:MAG TPA: hypothetical protein PK648_03505 [Verrucomicrobiales bacterium]|jgi:hypothetical protein|nr:hypothetical protein [Verrucomicrobiales bacterium]
MSREFVSFEDVILIADFGRTRDDPAMRHVFFFTALFPLLSATAAPVKFETEILPFLEKKCVECHSAPHADKNGKIIKPKAGLRMDAAWAIKAGSEDGAVLVAGKPPESELFLRVTLPTDDDDFMPPSGKADPLTPEETELFKRWIEEGADFGDWHGNLEGKPARVSNTGDVVPTSEIQEVYKRLATGLTLPEEKSWESVTAAGGRVTPLALASPLLSVDFRLATTDAGDEQILSAQVIAANIVHLDLSRTSATDSALALISETPNLVRLDLSNTSIGDEGLKHLIGLKELRYLNLHDSAVTDKGLDHLKGIKSLEAVYLWQSKVTEEGAKELRSALPNARINSK